MRLIGSGGRCDRGGDAPSAVPASRKFASRSSTGAAPARRSALEPARTSRRRQAVGMRRAPFRAATSVLRMCLSWVSEPSAAHRNRGLKSSRSLAGEGACILKSFPDTNATRSVEIPSPALPVAKRKLRQSTPGSHSAVCRAPGRIGETVGNAAASPCEFDAPR